MSKRSRTPPRQSGNPARRAAQQVQAAGRELDPAELALAFTYLPPYDLIPHFLDWSVYARRAATLSTPKGRGMNAHSRHWRYAEGMEETVELKTQTGWMTSDEVIAQYQRIEAAINKRWTPQMLQSWGSALEGDDRKSLCLTADPTGVAGEWTEDVLKLLEPLSMLEVFRVFAVHQLALSEAASESDRAFGQFRALQLTSLSPWEWFQMFHERAESLYPIV